MQPYTRILVVDDDEVSLSITAMLLEAEGFEVRQAASGDEACDEDQFDSWTPDYLLADLCMPGLSGAELAERAKQRWPAVRAVAMSAGRPEPVEGYERVLQKPLPLQGLRAILESRDAETPAPTANSDAYADALDTRVFEKLERSMPTAALHQLYKAFFHDAESRLRTLAVAIDTHDVATVRREAHTLRGSAGMTGATAVRMITAEMEEGIDSPDHLRDKFSELRRAFDRLSIILARKLT